MVREIDTIELWDKYVLDGDGDILVEFFATWCPHCKKMQPIVEELSEMSGAQDKVFQIDIDKMPQTSALFANNGVPTFVLFSKGVPRDIETGECDLNELVDMLARRRTN